jgi:putative membrane protein
MKRETLFFGLTVLPGVALAHNAASETSSPWQSESALLIPLLVSGLWYAIGYVRLWHRATASRRHLWRSGASFGLGWLILAATLLSRLHELGEVSFTAHMTEHELLMLVAAPLMALSRPLSVFLWACPHGIRRALVEAFSHRPVSRAWRLITTPAVATLLQILALWLWHTPSLFEMALENEVWHAIQHLSFLGTALLFWWSLTRSHHHYRRAIAALCLFITSLATGALGALMAISSSPWYPGYAALGLQGLLAGGLTAAEDQQLAGLIMWIPGGLVHFVAALLFAHAAMKHTGAPHRATV